LNWPAFTAFSAASMVGSMFHSALATTVSGYWAWVLITLPMASTLRSLAASLTPKRSAYITSAPLSIIASTLTALSPLDGRYAAKVARCARCCPNSA
jgi:flagellar motor component MotA